MRRTAARVQDFTHAPLMSLVSLLIPVLLMGASFVDLAVIESTLPAMCGCAGGIDDGPQPLNLSVYVHDWGIEVAGEDEKLFGRVAINRSDDELTEFTELLAEVKQRHPHEGRIVVVPDPKVDYGRMIGVLDASRRHDGEDLFMWPVIAGGVQ
jgi:hypothetical protein